MRANDGSATTRRGLLHALLLASAALAILAPAARGQSIQGTLRDRESNAPIATARVVLLTEAGDSVAAALTNASGHFVLRSPDPGGFRLRASALGYRETTAGIFDLERGGEMSLEFRIHAAPITLEEIVVAAPPGTIREGALIRNGFYERLTTGMGHFITPEKIAQAQGMRTSDLLFGIGRVSVVADEMGQKRVVMSAPMGMCSPPLYIDGVRVMIGPEGLDGLVDPFEIEAVEVYRGASELPLQWGGTSADGCGAIVIWTKGA